MRLPAIKILKCTFDRDTNSIIQTDYLTVSPNENLEKLVDLICILIRYFAVVDKEKHLLELFI
jgi:hypothetical protein